MPFDMPPPLQPGDLVLYRREPQILKVVRIGRHSVTALCTSSFIRTHAPPTAFRRVPPDYQPPPAMPRSRAFELRTWGRPGLASAEAQSAWQQALSAAEAEEMASRLPMRWAAWMDEMAGWQARFGCSSPNGV